MTESLTGNGETPYEEMKALLKTLRKQGTPLTVEEALAMARSNDPFYVGQAGQLPKAEWFAHLWRELGYEGSTGVHIRRIHYRLVTDAGTWKTASGLPYENTEESWNELVEASKFARHLGMVDPDAFVDRRAPQPQIFGPQEPTEPPSTWAYFPDWELPQIEVEDLSPSLELPSMYLEGYDYDPALEPYLTELWVEKSTVNDVLEPLCRRLSTNLVTGVGFMSITSVRRLLERRAALGKPVRILYISDYDPAGVAMPVSPSRQVEYVIRNLSEKPDIRLEPIVLTEEQVQHYQLPRIPIKDADPRKNKFQERYGEGAVELDAFAGLYPQEFRTLVRQTIEDFRDPALRRKLANAHSAASQVLEDALSSGLEPYTGELAEIEQEVFEIAERYRGRAEDLAAALRSEMEPYHARLENVRHAIQNLLDELEEEVELPTVSGEADPDDEDWLFDSRRDYLDQLAYYKKHQKK